MPISMAKSSQIVTVIVITLVLIACVKSHDDHGFHCDSNSEASIQAEYMPAIITLDGKSNDWDNIMGYSFPLLPALDPDDDKKYTGGEMTVKALYDGRSVFFLLQVPGKYQYVQGKSTSCPSAALMFQVGKDASYRNMGGCDEKHDSCSSKTCDGHEVDMMHFSIGAAIPGRLYGANIMDNINHTGRDSFGHLVDLYSWNPHCLYLDGLGPQGKINGNSCAQNDWQGAWWHDSIDNDLVLLESESPYSSSGSDGTYSFEFSRPLRTLDHLQQDVQFVIGEQHRFSAAFWYPVNNKPWTRSSHYSVSCDWVTLEIIQPEKDVHALSQTTANPLSVISFVLSLAALGTSLFVVWSVRKGKANPFTPIDNL